MTHSIPSACFRTRALHTAITNGKPIGSNEEYMYKGAGFDQFNLIHFLGYVQNLEGNKLNHLSYNDDSNGYEYFGNRYNDECQYRGSDTTASTSHEYYYEYEAHGNNVATHGGWPDNWRRRSES